MGSIAKYMKHKLGLLTVAVMSAMYVPSPIAWAGVAATELPDLKEIKHGDISISAPFDKDGTRQMNIGLSGKQGIINWNTFNIGSKAGVNFTGNVDKWMILNRVVGNNASEIYGSITSSPGGEIFLVNPHGITFHEHASVDVGSLVASTRQISDDDFINNRFDFYTDKDTAGKNIDGKIYIKNGADVKAEDGYVALLAQEIHNSGTITAPDVALATGQKINLKYDNKI